MPRLIYPFAPARSSLAHGSGFGVLQNGRQRRIPGSERLQALMWMEFRVLEVIADKSPLSASTHSRPGPHVQDAAAGNAAARTNARAALHFLHWALNQQEANLVPMRYARRRLTRNAAAAIDRIDKEICERLMSERKPSWERASPRPPLRRSGAEGRRR